MKNIKIGNQVFQNVEYISCKCAENDSIQRLFADNDDMAKPLEVPTNAGMVALLVASNIGKVYKFTGETDSDFTNGEIYEVVEE